MAEEFKMSKFIMVGEEKLTKMQYKNRVTFLLNEALDNGLIQYLPRLESLFNHINGDKLYTVECLIGDYIYLNRKVGVSNESI
jgi:hypothetical protein